MLVVADPTCAWPAEVTTAKLTTCLAVPVGVEPTHAWSAEATVAGGELAHGGFRRECEEEDDKGVFVISH